MMINASINQKDITVLNVYALNIRASKYTKQKLIELKKEIDKFTVIVVDFNIPLSTEECRQNKYTENQ